MADQIENQNVEVVSAEPAAEVHEASDAQKGAVMGGVGGVIAGAMAGAIMGPGGALIGAIAGGAIGAAASGAAVAVVDKIDYDDTFTGFPNEIEMEPISDRDPLIINRTQMEVAAAREARAKAFAESHTTDPTLPRVNAFADNPPAQSDPLE